MKLFDCINIYEINSDYLEKNQIFWMNLIVKKIKLK